MRRRIDVEKKKRTGQLVRRRELDRMEAERGGLSKVGNGKKKSRTEKMTSGKAEERKDGGMCV